MGSLVRRVVGLIRNEAAIQRLERRIDDLEAAERRLTRLVDATREHIDVVASVAVDRARSHAESASAAASEFAISAAREHTEAAMRAGVDAAVANAREHAEASARIATESAIAAAREHAEASSAATVLAAREHAEAIASQVRVALTAELAPLRREMRALERASGVPIGVMRRGEPTIDRAGEAPIDSAFYAALEDRFRGSAEEIERRQAVYVDLVAGTVDNQFPLVDLGCGRGEWLRVLARAGLPAFGIDSNPTFVTQLAEEGLNVREGDLVEFLFAQADGSLGAISMFQVVEHLPFAVMLDVLAECTRVLRPGGVLIAETPNALNLRVAASQFWLDPTHIRPLHPELLEFAAGRCGFVKIEGWFLNPLMPEAGLLDPSVDSRLDDLYAIVNGPGDYALIAWT